MQHQSSIEPYLTAVDKTKIINQKKNKKNNKGRQELQPDQQPDEHKQRESQANLYFMTYNWTQIDNSVAKSKRSQ